MLGTSLSTTTADTLFSGATGALGRVGTTVAIADLDADGYADLIVGAPNDYTVDTYAGAVYLFAGPNRTDGTAGVDEDAAWQGAFNDYAGVVVRDAGDLDGDGITDLLVGSEGRAVRKGFAAWIYGDTTPRTGTTSLASTADAWMAGEAEYDNLGRGLFALGDQDGDGYADIGLGAPYYETDNRGAIYVHYGAATRLSGEVTASDADAMLVGTKTDLLLGSGPGAGDDLDGDGLADLAMGSWSAGGSHGAVFVLYATGSRLSGTVELPTVADARLSGSVTSQDLGRGLNVRDVDDDGYADMLVFEEYGSGSWEGSLRVLRGAAVQLSGDLDPDDDAWMSPG